MDNLIDTFHLHHNRYVFLIGGGGKTTVLRTLARRLALSGKTVLATTSTHTMRPPAKFCERVVIEDRLPEAIAQLRSAFREQRLVTLGRALVPPADKLSGFSAEQLDDLRQEQTADYILVEADGSAGRSLKAHNDYEPVVSTAADLVIAVVGIDCVGKALTDEHVHRAERFAELTGRPLGANLTIEDISAILLHPSGYFRKVAQATQAIVLITKVHSAERRETASQLAEALREADTKARIHRIVMGEFVGTQPYIISAKRGQ